MLSSWGRSHRSRQPVVRPGSGVALGELVATIHGGITARGAGCSYADAALGGDATVIDCTARGRILDFDPREGVVVVQAGATLRDVQIRVLAAGWTLPVLPGTARVTVGGAVASDVHGKNHVTAGSFGRHVRWLSLITPDGESLHLSPTDQPAAFWATVGGMGLTGLIDVVAVALHPVETSLMVRHTRRTSSLDHSMSVLWDAAGCPTAQMPDPSSQRDDVADALQEGRDDLHAVAWLDGSARGAARGRGVVEWSWHAAAADVVDRLRVTHGSGEQAVVPSLPGWGVVNRPTIWAGNTARWLLARRSHATVLPIDRALHPLDRAVAWPAMFGSAGLVQYQYVVPVAAGDVIGRSLALLSRQHTPPALSVLKCFGAQGQAPLSFPLPGWSLALDFPGRWERLGPVLRELSELVAGCGGRVYLTKDHCLTPDLMPAMYPRLDEWRRERDRIDPHGRMRSGLSDRLGLSLPRPEGHGAARPGVTVG